ncbi:3-methylornithine--L-lysine ligase PylC [Sporomusa acidovorans]|uniref:ATP-grasp domain-containing protein n=1 Tax=Sporomusa acidovorans (strain ATCC 49682 / DSM 3132 / Mol) TaxID=1123286 RepID=A0ABZ3IWL3_SPOA4|nr:3-methylornithine--L-lysine ligase PylC [Sporomusa acidovorans]OZC24036.1 3-methylornithine--L-lysine ligase [Sporomusa acidovorans DSM 3132]SDF58325.1 pyrrolysine biosynthesis protein PylC [Sporomusa acidovorans]
MRVAVLGGKLQGVEACYLAKKAGWQVALVDRNPAAPAVGLCDDFYSFDLMQNDCLLALFSKVQFVVPALEDKAVLDNILNCARQAGVKLVYDQQAYALSASKLASDQLFAAMNVPAPRPWPLCELPVTVKPSGASGSENVYLVSTGRELENLRQQTGGLKEWVVQEFLEGPSYSLEVVGCNGQYRVLQVTELGMDEGYDCKRVGAPAPLPAAKEQEFCEIALALAQKLQLEGIMDVEAIYHKGLFKVLEIDARLPSQTLTAVYNSSGINALEVLWSGLNPTGGSHLTRKIQGVIYEHIRVTPQRLEVCGEHIMASAGHLTLYPDFFGADEALSNYRPGKSEWVATLIVKDGNRRKAWQKRCRVINSIMCYAQLSECYDAEPPLPAGRGTEKTVRLESWG